MLNLIWKTCGDDAHWCDFFKLDLSKNLNGAAGVYMIFYLGDDHTPGKVVRVGQGDIADRIAVHREDPEVLAYRDRGLLVTWATVHGQQQGGVEKHLSDAFEPLVGERFPNRTAIEVNSPFD